MSDDYIDDVSRRNAARLRRKSVQLYGHRNSNTQDSSDNDSDSALSLHRNRLHRQNMLVWRDHWQPTSAGRFADIDPNNNDNDDGLRVRFITKSHTHTHTHTHTRLTSAHYITLPL